MGLKSTSKVLMLFISRVWGRPWLACHLSPARKFPNIARTNQNSFQNCGNWIPFLENLSVLFFDGPRVIKGGSWLNWCKVRPGPCQSERIVPIWGVVRKSKCQPRKEIRSEWAKKSIFRIWANVAPLQIQRWGRLKLGRGLRARPLLLRFAS